MGLEELFGKKPPKKPSEDEQQKEGGLQEKLRAAFYRKVIERYAALIDENEQKTVPELKTLVQPEDEVIQELKGQVLEGLVEDKALESPETYAYELHFLKAAEKAFFAIRKIQNLHADLNVLFWLKPREALELQAGDLFDKALLLCSLLRALGSPKAKIRVLELEKSRIHPVVMFSFGDTDYLLDASQKESKFEAYSGKREEALQAFSFDECKYLKSAYEFNDQEYQEFEDRRDGEKDASTFS